MLPQDYFVNKHITPLPVNKLRRFFIFVAALVTCRLHPVPLVNWTNVVIDNSASDDYFFESPGAEVHRLFRLSPILKALRQRGIRGDFSDFVGQEDEIQADIEFAYDAMMKGTIGCET